MTWAHLICTHLCVILVNFSHMGLQTSNIILASPRWGSPEKAATYWRCKRMSGAAAARQFVALKHNTRHRWNHRRGTCSHRKPKTYWSWLFAVQTFLFFTNKGNTFCCTRQINTLVTNLRAEFLWPLLYHDLVSEEQPSSLLALIYHWNTALV